MRETGLLRVIFTRAPNRVRQQLLSSTLQWFPLPRMIDLQSSCISACVLEAALIRVANADSYVVQNCKDAALRSIPPASVHPVHGVHSAFLNLGRQIRVYQLAAPKLGEGGCPSVVKNIFSGTHSSFPKANQGYSRLPKPIKGFFENIIFFFPPPKSARAFQSTPKPSKVFQAFFRKKKRDLYTMLH